MLSGVALGNVATADLDVTLLEDVPVGNADAAFAIDAMTGAIAATGNVPLDFEQIPSRLLTVTVTDDGSQPLSDDAAVTIDLRDVNESPQLGDRTSPSRRTFPAERRLPSSERLTRTPATRFATR